VRQLVCSRIVRMGMEYVGVIVPVGALVAVGVSVGITC